MSKPQKRIDMSSVQQIDLFGLIEQVSKAQAAHANGPLPGSLNISAAIRAGITAALKKCPHSRYQVAARMSELLGREITKAQLDAYTAESKDGHRFPLEFLPAFMEATGDTSIIRLLAEKSRGYYIQGEDALRMELGRISEERRVLREREKIVTTMLRGEA